MSTALMQVEPVEPLIRLRDKVDLLRGSVAKGATPAQLELLMNLGERYQLDPLLKEIWFVPEVGVITGRDGYLKIAMRHPDYEGIVSAAVREGDEFTMEPLTPTVHHKFGPKRGAVIGAYAVAFRRGRRPSVCYADMNEYRKGGNVWQKYQSAMISKVAEVMALKRQFGITGLVAEEEASAPRNDFAPLEQPEFTDVTPEPFREPVKRPVQSAPPEPEDLKTRITQLKTECVAHMGVTDGLRAFDALLNQHGVVDESGFKTRGQARKFIADLDERLQTFRTAPVVTEDRDSWLPEGFGEPAEVSNA